MTKRLFKFKGRICVVLLFLLWGSIHAQNLKTSANQQTIKKGHALYKQTKIYDSRVGATEKRPKRKADNAVERMRYEYERLRNPFTGQIPAGIRDLEVKFSKKIKEGNAFKTAASARSSEKGGYSYWKNRGPYNVGGRTRALAIDRTNENIIFAGGVSGGLWRSTDNGKNWKKITSKTQSPNITCIVQDPRPGKENIWYYGTGERSGNTASTRGGFYAGTGIYKSTNGGRTWRLLESTSGDVRPIIPFYITNSIAVNPTNGDLYVATFEGLYRSKDQGYSFREVLAGGRDNRVEVSISSQGQIYATIESDGDPNAGFFTSTDGDNWTDITPEFLPKTLGRTVVGINPSNEDEAYFFSKNDGDESEAFLLKYNAGAEEDKWIDLSANLPVNIGGYVGNLNLQGGYNMIVKVHPQNDSIVFVGGTNLYRSTTGFTTPASQESWIAGYSPKNNVSVYPNQHPDQHELIFYSSNPNKVLSGNDGGVFLAEDITTSLGNDEPVKWTSLNNGYITTQPYHVSFDPEANSDDLLAGFQDNGTWYTSSIDPKKAWEEDFSGDGSYSAIADGGRTRYVSSQNGNIYRFNFDEEGEAVSYSRVRPSGASGFSFINPFILDPNNDNIMYLPVGNKIWRNNDLDALPLNSNRLATVNWVELLNSATPAGTRITALDISTFPVANKLYYGTNGGNIYKMNNANVDGQEAVDISTGKGLPETGFVNDINVDPSNENRVIVTFSNYGIQSLFLTEDAGETWVNISGNLEENKDGTGNGPSVRSTAFFGSSTGAFGTLSQKVFAATSTGLYFTFRLNGENTRWIKEPFVIGNAVVDEVKTRKDGFIAVAAHGNGLFSAKFPILFNQLPEGELTVDYLLDDYKVGENSQDTIVNVADLFKHSQNARIAVTLENSNPELVTATLKDDKIFISYAKDTKGTAAINLIATSGVEQVAEGFTITVAELSIYEQIKAQVNTSPSQNFTDFNAIAQTADDFIVPEGNTWKLNRVLVFGAANNSPSFTTATVVIYADNDGAPGEEIYNSGEIQPISEATNANFNLPLPEAITVTSGTYWLSVYANLSYNPGQTQWFWGAQEGGIGQESKFKDAVNLFGTGATDWTNISEAFESKPVLDQIFQLFGDIEEASFNSKNVMELAANTLETPLASVKNDMSFVVFPNPSSDRFVFNFKSLGHTQNVTVSIYDGAGKLVSAKSGINPNNTYEWNASNQSRGFYYVTITGKGIDRTLKVLKK